jgi:hypothetical protein
LKQMYLYYFWFNTFWNTNLLTNLIRSHDLSIRDQIKLFFDSVDQGKMPFIKTLVDEYKSLLDCAFSEDEVRVLDNLYHCSFFKSHQGRGKELFEIVENLDAFKNDINLIYPDFDPGNVKKFETDQAKSMLFTPFVILTKK